MPSKDNNVAECDDDEDAKDTIVKSCEQLLDILTSSDNEFDIKMEALRDMNLLLEDCSDEISSSIKNDSTIKNIVKQLPKFLVTAGDFEMQMSLIESMVRLIKKSERPLHARSWFQQQQLAVKFLEIKDSCFDADCRKFLNYLNETAGKRRSVYSYAAVKAYLGYHKLVVPKGGNLSGFWVDFNSVSKCVTIYVDDENDANDCMWETITINADDVNNYTIKEEGSYNLLQMNLNIPVSDLFDKCRDNSQVAQMLFDKSVDITHALQLVFGDKPAKKYRSIGKTSVSEMDICVNKSSKSSHRIKHPNPDLMPQMPDLITSPTSRLMDSSRGHNQPRQLPSVLRIHDSMLQPRVSVPLNPMMSPAREMLAKPGSKTTASANGSGQSKNNKYEKDLPKTPKAKQGGSKRVKTPLRITIPNDKSTTDTASDTDKEPNVRKTTREKRRKASDSTGASSETDKEPNVRKTTKEKRRKSTDSIGASSDTDKEPNVRETTKEKKKKSSDSLGALDEDAQSVSNKNNVKEPVADGSSGCHEHEDIGEEVTEVDEASTKSDKKAEVEEEDFPVVKSGCLVPIHNDSDTIPDSLPIPSSYNSQLCNMDRSELYTKKVYLAALTPTLSTVSEEESSRSKHTTPTVKQPEQENLDKNEAEDDDLNLSQDSAASLQSVKILLTSQTTRTKPKYNPSLGGHKKQVKPSKPTTRVHQQKVNKHEDIDEVILENEYDPYDFQVEKRPKKSKNQKEIHKDKEESRSKFKKPNKGNKKNPSIKAKKVYTENKHDEYSFEVSDGESNIEMKFGGIVVEIEDDEPIPYDQFHNKIKEKKKAQEKMDVEEYQEDSLNDFKEQNEEKKYEIKGKRDKKRKFGKEVNNNKPTKGKQNKSKRKNKTTMDKENTNIEIINKKQNAWSSRERKEVSEIEMLRDACPDNTESEMHDADLQEFNMIIGSIIKDKKKQPGKSAYERNMQLTDSDEKFLQEGNDVKRSQKRKQKKRKEEVIDDVTSAEELDEVEPAKINTENAYSQGYLNQGLKNQKKENLKENNERKEKKEKRKSHRNANDPENSIVGASKHEMNKIERNEDTFVMTRKSKTKNKESKKERLEEIIVDSDIEEKEEEEEEHRIKNQKRRMLKENNEQKKKKQKKSTKNENDRRNSIGSASEAEMSRIERNEDTDEITGSNKNRVLETKSKNDKNEKTKQIDMDSDIENEEEEEEEERLENQKMKVLKGNEQKKKKGKSIRNQDDPGKSIMGTSISDINRSERNEDTCKMTAKNRSRVSGTMNKESRNERPEEIIVDSDTEEEEEDPDSNDDVNSPPDDAQSVTSFTKMCQVLLTDVKRPRRSRKSVNYQDRGSSVDDSPSLGSAKNLSTETNEELHNEVTGAPANKLRCSRENDAVSTVSRRSWLIEKQKKQVSTYSKGHTNVWVQHSARAAVYASPWISDSSKKADGKRNKKRPHPKKSQKRLSSLENQFLEPITIEDNTSDINEQDNAKRRRTVEREDELVHVEEKRKLVHVKEKTKSVSNETTPSNDISKKQPMAPHKILSKQSDTSEQSNLYFRISEDGFNSSAKSTTSSGNSGKEHSVEELLNFHFDFEEDFMAGDEEEEEDNEQEEEEVEEEEEAEMLETLAVPEKTNSDHSSYKTPKVKKSVRVNQKEVQDDVIDTNASGPSKNPRPSKSTLKRKYEQEIEDESDADEEPEEKPDVAIYEMMEKQSVRRKSSLLIPKKLFQLDQEETDNDYLEERHKDKVDEVDDAEDLMMTPSCSNQFRGSDNEEIGEIQELLHFVGGTIKKQIQAKQKQTKLLTGCAINTATKHVKSLWSYQQTRLKEFEAIKKKILAEVISLEEDLESMKRVEQKSMKLMKQLQEKLTTKLDQNITDMRNLHQEFQEKRLKLEGCLQKQLRNGFDNIISQEMNELKNRLLEDSKHQELMQMKRSLSSFFASV